MHRRPSVQGSWLRLAGLMGYNSEMAIFRRFRKLNFLRLLEMQSDLMQQQQDFELFYSFDADNPCSTTQTYKVSWESLTRSEGQGGSCQRDAWIRLRESLEAYNSALLRQIKLCKQGGPSIHDLNQLRYWLASDQGNASSLRDRGWDAWRQGDQIEVAEDYIAMSSRHQTRDRFERWTGETFLGLFHRFIGRRLKPSVSDVEIGLTEYKDARISNVADIICTILAPLIVTVPMFVLNYLTDVKARLGIIMVSTTLFSTSLAIFSSARRIEVFAATSAFAAVQVVFGAVQSP